MIFSHAPEAMNAVRDEAFEDFKAQGFPSKKVERYKYTDIQKLFEPNFGVNVNRLQIPVDPYETFRCDVPNLSTSLYFVVNDMFFHDEKPKGHLPEGVVIGSMRDYPELVSKLMPIEDEADMQPIDKRLEQLDEIAAYVDEQLGEPHRSIFRLRFDEDLTIAEIARRLGLNQSTAYKYLMQSIQQIKNHFKK